MKISTEILKDMVSKVIKGAGNNNLVYISSLIAIDYVDGKLSLLTTDGNNNFIVTQNIEVPIEEDYMFYAVVNAEQFSKLVSKTTKEFVELIDTEKYLEFKGNGSYKLDLAINEEGELIRFPETITNLDNNAEEINLKDLQDAIKTAKASTLKNLTMPMLTGYYIGEVVMTTDRQLVCKLDKQLVTKPILLTPEMAELLLLVNDDTKIILERQNDGLLFRTNKYIIYGKELDGKEDYANGVVAAVNNLISLNYNNMIKVNKNEFLEILNRLNIFVNAYDDNGVYLKFAKNNSDIIRVQSKKSNAIENLTLKEANITEDFECLVNIEMLKSQLQSLNTDLVELYFGQKSSIQLKEGNTTLVVALLDNN